MRLFRRRRRLDELNLQVHVIVYNRINALEDRCDLLARSLQATTERYLDLESRVADLEAQANASVGAEQTGMLRIQEVEASLKHGTSALGLCRTAEEAVELAIRDERSLRFLYRKLGEDDTDGEWRALSPYETSTARDGARTVLGWDHVRHDIRTFRIDRMAHWSASYFPYREAEVTDS